MFTNTPLPRHALQAAVWLNGGARTFIAAEINVMLINTV